MSVETIVGREINIVPKLDPRVLGEKAALCILPVIDGSKPECGPMGGDCEGYNERTEANACTDGNTCIRRNRNN